MIHQEHHFSSIASLLRQHNIINRQDSIDLYMDRFSHCFNGLKTFLRAKLGRVPDPPDVEMGEPAAAAEPKQPNRRVLVGQDYWADILALFCSAFAMEMAVLFDKELPAIFYFLAFSLMLAFTCFFVGRCIRSKSEQAAEVLERVGIFFGVTAIFISITIPFPALWFKCVTGFIYALCWLTILACYFHSYLLRVCNKVLRVYNKLTELLDIDRRNKIPSQISSQTLKILGWDSSSARSLGSEIIHVEQQQRSNSDSFFDIRQIGTRCRELLLESML